MLPTIIRVLCLFWVLYLPHEIIPCGLLSLLLLGFFCLIINLIGWIGEDDVTR